jgi:hypothetical protein
MSNVAPPCASERSSDFRSHVSAGVVSLQIDAAGVRTTDKVTIANANQ